MSTIKKVAVIGTGVIGTGWVIRCLAHDKLVYAYDIDLKLKNKLLSEIKRTWPFVKKLFKKKNLNLKNFKYFTSLKETLKDADFIQECATENYNTKTKLMKMIGDMQNQVQLFHPAHLDYCRQEFIQNAKILKEQLLDTLLTLFIYYQQLKLCQEKKQLKNI